MNAICKSQGRTVCALEITKHVINLVLRAFQFQNIGKCRKFPGETGMP